MGRTSLPKLQREAAERAAEVARLFAANESLRAHCATLQVRWRAGCAAGCAQRSVLLTLAQNLLPSAGWLAAADGRCRHVASPPSHLHAIPRSSRRACCWKSSATSSASAATQTPSATASSRACRPRWRMRGLAVTAICWRGYRTWGRGWGCCAWTSEWPCVPHACYMRAPCMLPCASACCTCAHPPPHPPTHVQRDRRGHRGSTQHDPARAQAPLARPGFRDAARGRGAARRGRARCAV